MKFVFPRHFSCVVRSLFVSNSISFVIYYGKFSALICMLNYNFYYFPRPEAALRRRIVIRWELMCQSRCKPNCLAEEVEMGRRETEISWRSARQFGERRKWNRAVRAERR